MRPLVLVLLCVFVNSATGATALVTGDRVRVTLIAREPQPVIGSVLELPKDELVLVAEPDSSRRAIPLAAIEKLEVSRGRQSSALKGAAWGALIFAIPGAVLGASAGGVEDETAAETSIAGAAAAGFAVGAVIGAGVGALLGSFGHHEKWKEVSP
jgi:hypothetical protein